MANYVLRVINPNQQVKNITLDRLFAVPAEQGSHYVVMDGKTMQPVGGVVFKRKDGDVIVEVDQKPVVHINRAFKDDKPVVFLHNEATTPSSQIENMANNDAQTPESKAVAPNKIPGVEKAAPPPSESGTWYIGEKGSPFSVSNILLGGVAVGGLVAIAAATGKKDNNQASSSNTNTVNNVVSGTVMAGPVIAGNSLSVKVYKSDGTTLLGEGTVDANGKFSVSVGGHTGVVVAKLENTGSAADFLDEVTNKPTDLKAELWSTSVIGNNVSNLHINITPLTTLAYLKLKESGNPSDINAVFATNRAVANVFGVKDVHLSDVVLVNATGTSFNAADGLSDGEKYGSVLAALSGMDSKADMQTTINNLKAALTINGDAATLSTTAQSDLLQGAQAYTATTGAKTITVETLDSFPPIITSPATAKINENIGEKQVVYQVSATDSSVLTYSLQAGEDADLFSMEAATGKVTLTANPDYETKAAYNFTVVATDAQKNTSSQKVKLEVQYVDQTIPSIKGLAFGETSASNNLLKVGDTLKVNATFSEAVNVTGTPQITMQIGDMPVTANYSSGSGTSTLVFGYMILADQNDIDGIHIPANSLALNGGSITDVSQNAAMLNHTTLGSEYKVDNVAPSLAASTVTNSWSLKNSDMITVRSNELSTVYIAGDSIKVNAASSITAAADEYWNSVSIKDINTDTSLAVSGLANGGYKLYAIDKAGNVTTFATGINILTSNISITSANGVQNDFLNAGDQVNVTTSFSENVTVTGTPQLALTIGESVVQANYESGSASDKLVFKYQIQAGQNDSNGISIAANSLTLNGGTIKNSAGNAVSLNHVAMIDDRHYKVDTSSPSLQPLNTYPPHKLEAFENVAGEDKSPVLSSIGRGGESVIAWVGQDADTAHDESIFVQKIGASDLNFGSTLKLEPVNKTDGTDAQVRLAALGSNGDYVVAWIGTNENGKNNLFVQKFNANHTLSGNSQFTLGNLESDAFDPNITQLANDGSFIVTWSVKNGDEADVYLQKVNPDSSLVAPVKLTSSGADSAPSVTMIGAAGEFVATWMGTDSTGDSSIYLQKFKADGSANGALVTLEAKDVTTGNDSNAKCIAVGSTGAFVVTWQGVDSNGDESVFVQQFNADGGKAALVQLEATGVNNAADVTPVISIIGAAGEYVIAWSGSTSSTASSIFVQRFDAAGVAKGNVVQLDSGNGKDDSPQVVRVGSTGEFVVVWSGEESATDRSIFVQKFNASGSTESYPVVKLEAVGVDNANDIAPQISALGDNGEFMVAWQGIDSNGDNSIFSQRFAANGSLAGTLNLQNNTSITLKSSEIGSAYVVNNSLTPQSEADIAKADDNLWNKTTVTAANTNQALSTVGLKEDGYTLYVADQAGNLVSAPATPVKIDVTAPTLTTLAFTESYGKENGVLNKGDLIYLTATFSEPVFVDGTPKLTLNVGGVPATASYITGSGSNELRFRYTVQTAQNDSNGVSVDADSLFLDTGSIQDAAQKNAILTHAAIADDANYVIDSMPPTITTTTASINNTGSVSVQSDDLGTAYLVHTSVNISKPSDITQAADNLWNTVNITAINTPTTLSAAGLADGDYRAFVVDGAGNLSNPAVNIITLESTSPSVDSIYVSTATNVNNKYLKEGSVLDVYVRMSEAVTVTGTPQLALSIGAATVQADYVAKVDSRTLSFKYTIQAGQADADGISVPANALGLNGGTIVDSSNNSASLAHAAMPNNANYKVDSVNPVFTSGATATAINEESGEKQVIYKAVATDDTPVTYSIKAAVDDASSFSINASTGNVTLIPDPDFETKPSYKFTVVASDDLGNRAEQAVSLAINNVTETNSDKSVVIFDLVQGVSSSHSNRTFKSDTTYKIYVMVDGSSSALSTDGTGSNAASTWGKWKGINTLGSDDKIILVGNNAAVKGFRGSAVNGLNHGSAEIGWKTIRNNSAAAFRRTGKFVRTTANAQKVTALASTPLAYGRWMSPNKVQTINAVYITKMPNGLMTSQGLA